MKKINNETPGSQPDWDEIFARLEEWRGTVQLEPAVNVVADEHARAPWVVLLSTVLSLRTKDEVTVKASRRLLARAKTPQELLLMSEDEIAGLIFPAGFYRVKAANLKKIAGLIVSRHGGQVPPDMEALLALPGVGRKTANLVLTEAFGLPGICVDTHVHRIANRAGWVETKSPNETEEALRSVLPLKYWIPVNALLVLYGQNLCKPISPLCSRCVIAEFCPRCGVGRSR